LQNFQITQGQATTTALSKQTHFGFVRSFAIFLLLTTCLVPTFLWGQVESTAITATGRGGVSTTFQSDYQAIGINPANLGLRESFKEPIFTVGMGEFHARFFSEAMDRNELGDAIFNSRGTYFSTAQKQAAADKVANTSLSLNVDINLLGASVKLPSGHGFAFSVRDRIRFFTKINQTTAELAFLGANAGYFPQLLLSDGQVINNPSHPSHAGQQDLSEATRQKVLMGLFENSDSASVYSEIMDGSRVSSSWMREVNLSYGVQLVEGYEVDVYLGAGVRYNLGIMLIELAAANGTLTASNISVSEDFGLDFGDTATVSSPTFRPPQSVSAFHRMAFPNPVGRGFGVDLGLTVVIKDNLRLACSLINAGQMTWDGNVYQVNDGKLVQFAGSGFNNYNVLASEAGAFQFAGDQSPLSWEGSSKIRRETPSLFRFGASYEFYKRFHIGVDVVAPRNKIAGNLEHTLYAVGFDFKPSKLFTVSSGFNFGGNNQSRVNFPLGLSYTPRKNFYEAGIATGDLTTFVGNIGQGSTFSLAAGFFKLKF